jgi:hypothetical protein
MKPTAAGEREKKIKTFSSHGRGEEINTKECIPPSPASKLILGLIYFGASKHLICIRDLQETHVLHKG